MSIWIQVTSGNGPAECCWVVARLAAAIEKAAAENGTSLVRLEETDGDHAGTYRSVVFSLDTDVVPVWLGMWIGTIQWIGKSPFRPNHGRKNWFVGVQMLKQPNAEQWSLAGNELRIETFRSSGKGGQNVNKVSSAVRITHLPTGKVAVAREERSQYQNRRLANERLKRMLQEYDEHRQGFARSQRWRQHHNLVRGNPVRIYTGLDFLQS
jgi:peptide chain release factor